MKGFACGLGHHFLASLRFISQLRLFNSSCGKSFAALKSQANVVSVILATAFIVAQAIIVADNTTYTGNALEETAGISASGDLADGTADVGTSADASQVPQSPESSQELQETAPSFSDIQNNNISSSVQENAQTAPSDDVTEPQDNTTEAPPSNASIAENPANETGQNPPLAPEEPYVAPPPEPVPVLKPSPSLEISLSLPSDIGRGASFALTATVKNNGEGNAKNAVLEIQVPSGVTVSDGGRAEFGLIKAGDFAEAKFTIQTSYGTALGANEILARVSYG